jgi:cell shape-determining protein MreC
MFDYRKNELNTFRIKIGSTGKIRLFFLILNHPWKAFQAINEFRQENANLEAENVSLKERLAEQILANCKLKEEIYDLKRNREAC